jgi:hypothetical protein
MDDYDYEFDYDVDVIYSDYRDAPKRQPTFYYSPDGIGRIFYDSIVQAIDETGFEKVIELTGKQERRPD